MAYFRCEIGTNEEVVIKNAKTANYSTSGETIEQNYLIEITQKPTSNQTVTQTDVYNYSYTPRRSAGTQEYYSGLYFGDCMKLSDNEYLLVVVEKYDYYGSGTGKTQMRYYATFEKLYMSNGLISRKISSSQVSYTNFGDYGGKFYKYNNNYYYISMRDTYREESGDLFKTTSFYHYVNKLTIGTSSISVTTTIHTLMSNKYAQWNCFDTVCLTKEGYIIASGGSYGRINEDFDTLNGFLVIYPIESTSSSNSYSRSNYIIDDLPQVTASFGDNKIMVQKYFSDGNSVSEGVYTYTATGGIQTLQQSTSSYGIAGQISDTLFYGLQWVLNFQIAIYEWNSESGMLTKKVIDLPNYNEGEMPQSWAYENNILVVRRWGSHSYQNADTSWTTTDEYLNVYYYYINLETNTATLINKDTSMTRDWDNNGDVSQWQSHLSIKNGLDFYTFYYTSDMTSPTIVFHKRDITTQFETCIKKAETRIDGITKTKCTAAAAGEVWVLN